MPAAVRRPHAFTNLPRAQDSFATAASISEVTTAHGLFVRSLQRGFFLLDESSSTKDLWGERTQSRASVGTTLQTMFQHMWDFALLVLELNEIDQSASATASAAAQIKFQHGLKELRGAFYARLADLFAGLHLLNRTTQPNVSLLSRLQAVEFWDKHVEVSY